MDEERQLMARLQGGDLGAFEALHDRFVGPLLNFFYQMCFDRIAAEDYAQETFLRVWRSRGSWRPIGKVSTWIFQIAKNYWLNEREKRLLRPFHQAAGGDDAHEGLNNLPDRAEESPAGAVGQAELAAALREAVSSLSDKLRMVFVMARYQGMPYAEIAEALEIPEGTVKSRMALAEKALRDRLARFLAT